LGGLGYAPSASLLRCRDGNFYGTTAWGGDYGNGTVFRMTPSGAVTTLISFTGNAGGNKGSNPYGKLLLGSDGNFYGTTEYGGAGGYGTVFKMTPNGILTTLVEFTGNGTSNKGSYPYGALVQVSDGSFYGTASRGGASNYGTVFKMTSTGVLTTLVEFTGYGATNEACTHRRRWCRAATGISTAPLPTGEGTAATARCLK